MRLPTSLNISGWSRMRVRLQNGRSWRAGHDVAWEFDGPGALTPAGLMIDGEILTGKGVTKRFFQPRQGKTQRGDVIAV
jgi:hypothetical protein